MTALGAVWNTIADTAIALPTQLALGRGVLLEEFLDVCSGILGAGSMVSDAGGSNAIQMLMDFGAVKSCPFLGRDRGLAVMIIEGVLRRGCVAPPVRLMRRDHPICCLYLGASLLLHASAESSRSVRVSCKSACNCG